MTFLSRTVRKIASIDARHVVSLVAVLAFAALALGSAAAPH
jgi:hypothetical protein